MAGSDKAQGRPLPKRGRAHDSRLGARVSLLRKARRLSVGELARRLSIAPLLLQKYERGTSRISAARLYEIALCLNVHIQYFFDDLGETTLADKDSESRVSAEDFLWVLARLKDEKLRWRVLTLISALVSSEN